MKDLPPLLSMKGRILNLYTAVSMFPSTCLQPMPRGISLNPMENSTTLEEEIPQGKLWKSVLLELNMENTAFAFQADAEPHPLSCIP